MEESPSKAISRLVKKLPPFAEKGVSTPCSQGPVSGLDPKPDESSPQLPLFH
jgi:hypothetical protein